MLVRPQDLLEPLTRTSWGRVISIHSHKNVARIALGRSSSNDDVVDCEIAPGIECEVNDFVEVLHGASSNAQREHEFAIASTRSFGLIRRALSENFRDLTVEAQFVGTSGGGLRFEHQGLTLWVASSLGDGGPTPGETRLLKLFGFNRGRRQINASLDGEPAALTKRDEGRRTAATHFDVGDTVVGRIKSITEYGAFVELTSPDGHVDGLLHKSEVAWLYSRRWADRLAIGDAIEVKVIDKPNPLKISLSRRQLTPSPWELYGESIQPGEILSGSIHDITDVGLLVEIFPGLEGLIHMSTLSYPPDEVALGRHYSVGQTLTVKVIEVDTEKQRLALGLATDADMEDGADANF